MTSGGISTRRHIVESVVKLLTQRPSREIHLADVAERAHVGVQTIYYHFDSRTQLIAEAQALTYYRLTEPFHEYITKAEKALRGRGPGVVLVGHWRQRDAGVVVRAQ